MKPIIKAVWFDDEYKAGGKDFIDICKRSNILITPFEDRTSGVKYLRENFEQYDVVILDGWFKKDPNSIYDDTGAEAIKVNKAIKQLKKSPPLEVFVFTARKKDKLFTASFGENRIYIKSRDEEKLIREILDHCNDQESLKLIHENQEVFELFDQHLSNIAKKVLIEILLAKNTEAKGYINLLRTVLDGVLKKLIENNYLPSEFLHGEEVNFKKCENFINESVVGEIMIVNSFGQRVKTPFNTILQPILHPGSHSEAFLTKNRYLVKGTAFFLMDLLLNLSPYIKTKAKEKNWRKVEKENGPLEYYLFNKGYGFIINKKYKDNHIWFHIKECVFDVNDPEDLPEGTMLSYTPRYNTKKKLYEAVDIGLLKKDG